MIARIRLPEVPGLVIRPVDPEDLSEVRRLNREIFEEDRVINTFDRQDLLILLAEVDGEPVGFKLGYRENRFVFYSAKGGVVAGWRGRGIAQHLLASMLAIVEERGYRRFAFDTFPNRHPGMTVIALRSGFRLVAADFNPTYRDFRLRFESRLQ